MVQCVQVIIFCFDTEKFTIIWGGKYSQILSATIKLTNMTTPIIPEKKNLIGRGEQQKQPFRVVWSNSIDLGKKYIYIWHS